MAKRKRQKRQRTGSEQNTKKALVDIIIPVHRRFDLLVKCLSSIPSAIEDLPYNIIIWDNASPPEEKQFYNGLDKTNITLIQHNENIGFPAACNRAVMRGGAPLLFFLNSDIILSEGSIAKLVKAIDADDVGIVGMKLLFPPDIQDPIRPAGKVQHVGLAINIRGDVIHPLLGWSSDNPKVNCVSDVIGVTGSTLLTTRSLWKKIGGFFEGYGLGTYEDIDYAMSARKLGYRVLVVPEAWAYHYVGATSQAYALHYPLNQNRMIFMQRWQSDLIQTDWMVW